jgi:protein gp37
MADKSKIEWTDATWNPVTGCDLESPGCTNCYAMKLAGTRLRNHPSRAGLTTMTKAGPVWNGQVRFNEDWLTQPMEWKRPRRVFVVAHGDLFHPAVPDSWIDKVFAVMALCPQHTFQILTKRAARLHSYLSAARAHPVGLEALDQTFAAMARDPKSKVGSGVILQGDIVHLAVWPLPNVWLGVSVEDQRRVDERIPLLLRTPAAKRFVSAEPLLGPVDLLPHLFIYTHEDAAALECDCEPTPTLPWRDPATTPPEDIDTPRLDWVIAGGESGANARPTHPDWIRTLRDQCATAEVPFFFKQWGEWVVPEDGAESCKVCGCTWNNACEGGCAWAAPRTCTSCVGKPVPTGDRPVKFLKVGKARAGAELDGKHHREWPQ